MFEFVIDTELSLFFYVCHTAGTENEIDRQDIEYWLVVKPRYNRKNKTW